jgi:hypothetical protein
LVNNKVGGVKMGKFVSALKTMIDGYGLDLALDSIDTIIVDEGVETIDELTEEIYSELSYAADNQ